MSGDLWAPTGAQHRRESREIRKTFCCGVGGGKTLQVNGRRPAPKDCDSPGKFGENFFWIVLRQLRSLCLKGNTYVDYFVQTRNMVIKHLLRDNLRYLTDSLARSKMLENLRAGDFWPAGRLRPLSTDDLHGMQQLGPFAEFERKRITTRINSGLAAAKKRGQSWEFRCAGSQAADRHPSGA
jgi:hypothetical protein